MFRRGPSLITQTQQSCRRYAASNPLTGKGKKPWDKRFPVSAKDISENKKGGSRKMQRLLAEHGE